MSRPELFCARLLLIVVAVLVGPLFLGTAQASPAGKVLVDEDLQYGADPSLLLDAYRADDARGAPIAILIHGGGWVNGDKDKFDEESTALAAAGFVVFNINYELVPETGPAYPGQVEDVHTALGWVQQHAVEYGGDARRIGVLGGSAGGYLAAMLAYQSNTEAEQPIRALVSLSGPMDLQSIAVAVRAARAHSSATCEPSCEAVGEGNGGLETLLGCDPVQCSDALIREASPSTYVNEYSPPSFFANSAGDLVPPEQAESVATRLRAVGVSAEATVIPGDLHGAALLPAIGSDLLSFLETNLSVLPTPQVTTPAPTSTDLVDVVTDDEPSGNGLLRWRWLVVGIALALLVIAIVARRARGTPPPP